MTGKHSAPILSVTALNQLARQALETALPQLWVEGEISNLVRAASGHLYFTLKDDQAQVRCTIWRSRAQRLAFRPENGMQVEARAVPTLYEARGEFQLNVDTLRRAGTGNLYEAFNRLKERLAAEGLFAAERKLALPRYPRAVGIITSTAAAALHDVLTAFARRAPQLKLVLYPAPVQGSDAAARLKTAIETANLRSATDGIDLLLLVRGGGSFEDLWSFNDEALARAIVASQLPVLSGIGHETDFTIADFVADTRAPTPTAAAELASAGWHEARQLLPALHARLEQNLQRRLHALGQRLDHVALRLVHPRTRLQQEQHRLERSALRMKAALNARLERCRLQQHSLGQRIIHLRPDITLRSAALAALTRRFERSTASGLERRQHQLQHLAAALQHLAPAAVLARGYAIVRDEQGQILRSAATVAADSGIDVELADGSLQATVKAIRHQTREP